MIIGGEWGNERKGRLYANRSFGGDVGDHAYNGGIGITVFQLGQSRVIRL